MATNSELESGDIYKGSGRISLNFADVSDGFVTLPPGIYPAVVSSVEEAISKPKDDGKGSNPMLVWEYTVDTPQYRNVTLKDWTVLTKNAMWKVKDVVRALGVPIAEDGSCDFDPIDLVGTMCQLQVENNTQVKKDRDTGMPVMGPDGKPEQVTFHNIKKVLPAAEGQTASGLV